MTAEHASKSNSDPGSKQYTVTRDADFQTDMALQARFDGMKVADLQRLLGNQGMQRAIAQRRISVDKRNRIVQRDDYHGGRMLSPGARERWTLADREMLRGVVGMGGVLTGRQSTRVPFFVTMLNDEDYARFRQLLDGAGSDVQRGYICKALTQISQYSIDQLEAFAAAIRSMSDEELVRRLNVVDTTSDMSSTSDGTPGITQQFNNSCVVTSAQADRAQDDPIYAFELTANPITQSPQQAVSDWDTLANPTMADEQYRMLADQGAIPSDRSVSMAGLNHAAYERVVNSRTSTTGLEADMRPINGDFTVQRALEIIRTSVESGIRVYIRVGNGASGGHAVLVLGYDTASDTYRIHDPWRGRTIGRTGQQFTNASLSIAGWNQLTHVHVPQSVGLPETQPGTSTTST